MKVSTHLKLDYRQCKLPRGCWELNSGPLEKHPMLLTIELSLQPLRFTFKLIQVYKQVAIDLTQSGLGVLGLMVAPGLMLVNVAVPMLAGEG